MTKKCPNCDKKVTGHPNKKFCNSKCKDRYHNRTNPRGYGLQRLLDQEYDRGEGDYVGLMDGHGQWED